MIFDHSILSIFLKSILFFGFSNGVIVNNFGYVDLSYSMSSDTLFYPGQLPFQLKKDYEDFKNQSAGYAAFSFCMGEHGGTHLDAPYHFAKDSWTVEKIPNENLINVRGIIIDVRKELENMSVQSEYAVKTQDFLQYEEKNGLIPHGSLVMIYTGWSKWWPVEEQYFGYKNESGKRTLNFPGVSLDAARWLYNERNIIGLGIDTPSVDLGNTGTSAPVHRFLARKNVYNLENVANLHLLLRLRDATNLHFEHTITCFKYRFHVLPLKIVGGTGAPAQILGFCSNI